MNEKRDTSRREKYAAVGLVICFVGMIAIVGMMTFSQYKRNQMRLAENEEQTQTTQSGTVQSEIESKTDHQIELKGNSDNAIQEQLDTSASEKIDAEVPEPIKDTYTSYAPTLEFKGGEALIWPIDGDVIMSYSMDQTIYFPTLDQYKYNSAIVISGEVGDEVKAATDGEVESVTEDPKTGTTITINIGSGYKMVYGQLKEVAVKEGDRVAKGDVIAYLSEPTKYYTVEGCNLYFQLLKDGKPVNPLDYIVE